MLSDSEDMTKEDPGATLDAGTGDPSSFDPEQTEVSSGRREIFTPAAGGLRARAPWIHAFLGRPEAVRRGAT